MKRAKLRRMLAEAHKPKMGRPRKFSAGVTRFQVAIPDDLVQAARTVQEERCFLNFPDAIRELLRQGAEARGLVEPRK